MDRVELFNFSEALRPYGEDRVSYEYSSGNLVVKVFYDEVSKSIALWFLGCSYQYFAPFPGYSPFSRRGSHLTVKSIPVAGCVYEHFGTELLEESENVAESFGYKPNHRHFSFYLANENVSFDLVAQDFKFETTKL